MSFASRVSSMNSYTSAVTVMGDTLRVWKEFTRARKKHCDPKHMFDNYNCTTREVFLQEEIIDEHAMRCHHYTYTPTTDVFKTQHIPEKLKGHKKRIYNNIYTCYLHFESMIQLNPRTLWCSGLVLEPYTTTEFESYIIYLCAAFARVYQTRCFDFKKTDTLIYWCYEQLDSMIKHVRNRDKTMPGTEKKWAPHGDELGSFDDDYTHLFLKRISIMDCFMKTEHSSVESAHLRMVMDTLELEEYCREMSEIKK